MAKRPFAVNERAWLAGDEAPAAGDGGSRTLIEQACAQLRADIIEGRLAPGEKLRVEHLKAHYSVGAGTLREAITRLVSDALVIPEGQRGFRVTPIAVEDLEDLTQLRVHIEIEALRQSIRHGDDAWRARLTATYVQMSSFEQPLALAHVRPWEELNLRFHHILTSGRPSAWTDRVLGLLSRHGERYRHYSIAMPETKRDVHAEHRAVYEAAMAGNELRAALALEQHIRATADLVGRALRQGQAAAPAVEDKAT